MRKKIVAGNWKMHKNAEQTEDLLNELIANIPAETDAQVIVAPTFINLASAVDHLEFTNINVSAQNMHQAESGAYTGEISADMLKSIGVNTVILGHSERRAIFHETDALIANKVDTAIKHDMTVIFCFGEELKDRQSKNHFNIVENQLRDGLFQIEASDWEKIILAYEPVWAIGTGETASPEQAQSKQPPPSSSAALETKVEFAKTQPDRKQKRDTLSNSARSSPAKSSPAYSPSSVVPSSPGHSPSSPSSRSPSSPAPNSTAIVAVKSGPLKMIKVDQDCIPDTLTNRAIANAAENLASRRVGPGLSFPSMSSPYYAGAAAKMIIQRAASRPKSPPGSYRPRRPESPVMHAHWENGLPEDLAPPQHQRQSTD